MKLSNERLAKANNLWVLAFYLSGGIQLNKKDMRQTMLSTLRKLNQVDYLKRSRVIQDRLMTLNVVKNAQTIALTMSNFPEVETREIITYLWNNQKIVLVPKCDVKLKKMHFYKIESFDQLEIVYAGIEEPIPSITEEMLPHEIDLLIVPGVLFNREGYRIGFGGGYYDRFLQTFKGETLSLAFDEQINQDIPIEIHDLPVDIIVTDQKVIDCKEVRHHG